MLYEIQTYNMLINILYFTYQPVKILPAAFELILQSNLIKYACTKKKKKETYFFADAKKCVYDIIMLYSNYGWN